MYTSTIRKIKPYLEKKIVKGHTYCQLARKARIDGKVERVWFKHLGTAAAIERVYDERDNLIPNRWFDSRRISQVNHSRQGVRTAEQE